MRYKDLWYVKTNFLQDPKEKIEHYIAHRYQREAQILVALEKQAGIKLTAMEVVKIVYTVSNEPDNITTT